MVNDPLGGGLDKDSGHGTFIAGIIRQVCPDALVLAIRVMPSDGVVDEHQLTIALNQLLVRQAQAQLLGAPTRSSTSCPCRWATTTSRRRTSSTPRRSRAPSTSSVALGVCVVASAGNDSTTNPMFPAGLAPAGGQGARREPCRSSASER